MATMRRLHTIEDQLQALEHTMDTLVSTVADRVVRELRRRHAVLVVASAEDEIMELVATALDDVEDPPFTQRKTTVDLNATHQLTDTSSVSSGHSAMEVSSDEEVVPTTPPSRQLQDVRERPPSPSKETQVPKRPMIEVANPPSRPKAVDLPIVRPPPPPTSVVCVPAPTTPLSTTQDSGSQSKPTPPQLSKRFFGISPIVAVSASTIPRAVPADFDIATKDSLRVAWIKWCCGDASLGYPPFREVSSKDIANKPTLRRLSNLRCTMQPIEALARDLPQWKRQLTMTEASAMFTMLEDKLTMFDGGGGKKSHKEIAWSTALNVLRRGKKRSLEDVE